PSVRDPRGECLAAFRTTLLRDCQHAAYLEYNWNGSAVDAVFELNQVG
ncbi:MAG: RES domain-containing protein, partial [Burkholderia sp.]|nr:RES domain-containing protein [Burkholderia sp.]